MDNGIRTVPADLSAEQPRGGGKTRTGVPRLTLWKPHQFLAHNIDPNSSLLGDCLVTKGELTSFLGIGGLGKTRLMVWYCICLLTGRPWCGLNVHGGPVRILFLSTENGLRRWKADLEKMFAVLSDAEKAIVDEHLFILALTPDEDADMNLGDNANVAKLIATLIEVQPALIVYDPFANMVDGDENSTPDMVKTIRILKRIHQKGAPAAAGVIIHHARSGAQNVIQAGDQYNAGNFGRGNKALFNAVRCELQLVPGDRVDSNRLVLCCGKNNNGEKFAPRGVVFDPITFTYSVDPGFSFDAWRADVAGQNRGQSCTIMDVVHAVSGILASGVEFARASCIIEAVHDNTGASRRAINSRINEAVGEHYLLRIRQGAYVLGKKRLSAAA